MLSNDARFDISVLLSKKTERKFLLCRLSTKSAPGTCGELSCSALPVALPFYLTELSKVGA